MNAAHLETRSPRSIARAHPYVVAAAATVGALAISALVNRHLANNAENDNPPVGQFLEVKASGYTMSNVAQARRWSCCTAMAA